MKITTSGLNIITALFGCITVLLFILLGVSGGFYNSIHTFLFQEVSYSISPFTEYKEFTVPIYKQFNLYLLLFAVLLGIRLKSPLAKLGSLYLSFAAVVGFVLLKFPMDAEGRGDTLEGLSHNIYTIILSLYITVALFLFVYAFRKIKRLLWVSKFTFTIAVTFLCTSIVAGIFAFLSKPLYVGFLERFAIGIYLFWIVVVAFSMLQSNKRATYKK